MTPSPTAKEALKDLDALEVPEELTSKFMTEVYIWVEKHQETITAALEQMDERLNFDEKKHVDKLLETAFEKLNARGKE